LFIELLDITHILKIVDPPSGGTNVEQGYREASWLV